jgi:hypothetical protein
VTILLKMPVDLAHHRKRQHSRHGQQSQFCSLLPALRPEWVMQPKLSRPAVH